VRACHTTCVSGMEMKCESMSYDMCRVSGMEMKCENMSSDLCLFVIVGSLQTSGTMCAPRMEIYGM
jgi:hypothetical protein